MDTPSKGITNLLKLYGSLCQENPSLTKRHLAIVMGGRIRNERPDISRLEETLMPPSGATRACAPARKRQWTFNLGSELR